MEFIICFILYLGLGLIFIALMLKWQMSGWDDIVASMPSEAQEAWYDHVREGGGMDLEDYRAWYEQKDKFDQMDEIDQLISELNTPLDTFGDPESGMDAVRRLDDVIDELVEIGDSRAVEPLIRVAKKRETFSSESAMEALGNFNNKRSIDYLVKSLKDKDRDIRTAAAEALDKLGWEPDD